MPADTPTPALIRAVRAGCEDKAKPECEYPDCNCTWFASAIRAAIAAFAEEGKKDE
jgi:hypothetical protein